MTAMSEALKALVVERGWKPGTHLENQVALQLSRWSHDPRDVEQQYPVGKYRLDFAWPKKLIGLEADGWWHRSPEGAVRDRQRDSWLRSQGWLIFRIDDEHGEDVLAQQLVRVTRFVRSVDDDWAKLHSRAWKPTAAGSRASIRARP